MGAPLIEDKRWSIDLEKRIQEDHYSDPVVYNQRYAFNPNSGKEVFVIDTPPPYPSGTWHICLLYTSPSPRDQRGSRMPSSA